MLPSRSTLLLLLLTLLLLLLTLILLLLTLLLLLLLSNCSIFPGFHDNIFNSLKIKIEQVPTIECVLVFDEMKLRRG